MSMLLQIQEKLNNANRKVAELEEALAQYPDLPSIAANLDSAIRLQSKFQAQFTEAAARAGIPICKYRAFDDGDEPMAGAALGSVFDFQQLVSVVFGALKYGKKLRANISSDLRQETAFGFGYAFSGSVGVVLTLRKDSDLFGDSFLADAISTIFALAKTSDPSEIEKHAALLGAGTINALYKWADKNASNGLGADIEWRNGAELPKSVFLQRQELTSLRSAIEQTSIEEHDEIQMEGVLVKADVTHRRFRLNRAGLKPISGTFAVGTIDEKHSVKLPRYYKVTINKTTKRQYAKGRDVIKYHLTKIEEFKSNFKHVD